MDVELLEKLDEILPSGARTRPEKFGITVKEFARQRGCSIKVAGEILNKAVDEGILQREQMIEGHGVPYVYFEKDTKRN